MKKVVLLFFALFLSIHIFAQEHQAVVVFQPVCPKSVDFRDAVQSEKISNFVLRLDEETGSAGEQPVSNKAAPTLKAVNVEGRL